MGELTDLNINVKIKKMRSEVGDLFYATPGSAGVDLTACIDRPVTIRQGCRVMIPTGIAIELPSKNFVTLIFARSGLSSKHGIAMANGTAVIDSDYRGEIICPMQNNSHEDYTINPGDRIGQAVFMPVALANFEYVEELDQTERGAGGFGSTGL